MKKLHVTGKLLRKIGACGVDSHNFDHVFPHGVVVTDDQETNFSIVCRAVERYTGLRVGWLTWNLYRAAGHEVWSTSGTVCPTIYSEPKWDTSSGEEYGAAGFLADAVGTYLKRFPRSPFRCA